MKVSKPVAKLAIRSALIVFGVSFFVIFLNWRNFFSRPETMFYDNRMVVTADSHRPSDEIAVVLVDQSSIDWGNQEKGWGWPWRRSVYGDIVRFFNLGEAASVTFDILFTEPSVFGVEDDEFFATACQEYGRVVQTVYLDQSQNIRSGWQQGVALPAFVADDKGFCDDPLLFPIESIASAAAVVGNITSSSDSDGSIRRAAAYKQFDSYYVPSLGIAPLFASNEEVPLPQNEPTEGRLLRFQPAIESYVPYSAAQILQSYEAVLQGHEPLLEPEMFQGMHVFFGLYAPGLFDICTTPVSAVYPGVGVHITQLDNYLQDSFLQAVPSYITVLLVILFATLGAVPLSVAEVFKLKKFNVLITIIIFVVCIGLFIFLAYGMFSAGIVLPMMPPLVSIILGFALAFIISYMQEGRQKRYLKSAFRQYLSPVVIEDLIANPERLSLGGARRHISIFFSDVQGFTTISENLEPEALTSLLNDYLSAMTDIILESGGTIDKYEGDAVIAFWNAPVDQPDHARRALEAAVACQKKLEEMRSELQTRAGRPFYMRIGLNTGDAIVGNMGSRSRFDYTMLGDSVNLAARLEGLNKQFGTYCMCSQTAKEEAEAAGTQLCFRELARAAVVGKKEAVTVYEPMLPQEYEAKKTVFEVFDSALKLFYEGDFLEAGNRFSLIKDLDAPAANYEKKCQNFAVCAPDMENWQGIWVATSK